MQKRTIQDIHDISTNYLESRGYHLSTDNWYKSTGIIKRRGPPESIKSSPKGDTKYKTTRFWKKNYIYLVVFLDSLMCF